MAETSVFRATFLGHNGWLLSSGRSHVLVDPLLRETFGATPEVGLGVYPPRRFDLGRFPRPTAVVFTHEHEDHFDIASLHLVDRSVPVYLPARSSTAMRTILGEMGFRSRLLRPGRPEALGDLELVPMTADQVHQAAQEEWDVLPFLMRDRAGHGSLFTHVDMAPSQAMWQTARRFVEAPGLWAYTCNNTRWSFTDGAQGEDRFGLARFTQFVAQYHERLTTHWAPAAALLVVGASYAFDRARAWLNHNVFPWSGEEARDALEPLVDEPVLAPLPGETLLMRRGKLAGTAPATPFVEAAPRSEWPARGFRGDVHWLASFQPATRRRTLSEGEIGELGRELDALAAHLYARDPFRRLYSIDEAELGQLRPTLVLALYNGRAPAAEPGGDLFFEYVPQGCTFVRVKGRAPGRKYAAIYECWASDLLAYLRCELSPTTLYFAHARSSSRLARHLRFDLNQALFEYVHPLRQPRRCLERYRRLWAEATATGVGPTLGAG